MEHTFNKKCKRENSSIIWDHFSEEYDNEEKQLYIICQKHLLQNHRIDKDHPKEPEITD
ncbi:4977_t:CDS:2, partial [Funneliformis geosporum]